MIICLTKKSKERLDRYISDSIGYNSIITSYYWFSSFKFLDPVFAWMKGDMCVSDAREEFSNIYLKTVGIDKEELLTLNSELEDLRGKVKYFESLIKENSKE